MKRAGSAPQVFKHVDDIEHDRDLDSHSARGSLKLLVGQLHCRIERRQCIRAIRLIQLVREFDFAELCHRRASSATRKRSIRKDLPLATTGNRSGLARLERIRPHCTWSWQAVGRQDLRVEGGRRLAEVGRWARRDRERAGSRALREGPDGSGAPIR
jgi:hypothetical protein